MKVDAAFLEQLNISLKESAVLGNGSTEGEFAVFLKDAATVKDAGVTKEEIDCSALFARLNELSGNEDSLFGSEALEEELAKAEDMKAEVLLQKIAENLIEALMQENEKSGIPLNALTGDQAGKMGLFELSGKILDKADNQLTGSLKETLKELLKTEQDYLKQGYGVESAEENEAGFNLQSLAEKILYALLGNSDGSEVETGSKGFKKVNWSALTGNAGGEAVLLKIAGGLNLEGEAEITPELKKALKEAGFLDEEGFLKEKAKAALEGTDPPKKAGKTSSMEEALEKAGLRSGNSDKPASIKKTAESFKVDPEVQKALESARMQAKAENVVKTDEQQGKAGKFHKAVPPVAGQDGIFQQAAVFGKESLQPGSGLPPQLQALRENIMQQLEGKLTYFRETGSSPAEMRMTLHPPELGELTIRVFSRQGQLSASILTESPMVREILEGSIAELRQRLSLVNVQLEQLEVSTQGQQFNGSGRSGAGDPNRENLAGGQPGNSDSPSGENEPGEPGLSAKAVNHRGIEYWA